ncbi:glutaredoxin family protein [Thalassotalea ganghwensis]
MMNNVTFYHAGCPVCVSAEQQLLALLDQKNINLEIVHFEHAKERIDEALNLGVESVPALVTNGQVLHINFGASMEDVKQAVGVA